ncbi:hypothetical protein Tco_0429070 [Tanacetum coccineum]
MNEGTKNTSYDYLFARKWASLVARQIEEETSSIIKLEDLAKLVSHVQPIFKDLDLPEDDPVIVMDDSDEDEDDEVHVNENVEIEDTLNLSRTKLKLKLLSLKLNPHFPISLPTEQKDLPSKLNELTGEVKGLKKQVHELEIELPGNLIEIPTKLDDFTKNVTSLTSQVTSVQAKLKTLDALPSLLLNVTQALNKFAQVLNFGSSKSRDQSVPSTGQANTMPAKGEKNTNQATISQLFQRRAEMNAEKENLNNQQPKPTTPPAITIIPPVISSLISIKRLLST